MLKGIIRKIRNTTQKKKASQDKPGLRTKKPVRVLIL